MIDLKQQQQGDSSKEGEGEQYPGQVGDKTFEDGGRLGKEFMKVPVVVQPFLENPCGRRQKPAHQFLHEKKAKGRQQE